MSGDVQPRKRKDKKRKKDELGVEEPRGTAAALGEGDVFMHSYQDHGTGGHWCAKIIFFSLLAVLITLIGLIILENRGLSELEANSVESRYSAYLEGWIEDAPEDDHHDVHTLELNHQDDDEEDHAGNDNHGDEEEHGDEDDHDEGEDDHDDEHDLDEDDEQEEQDLDSAEDEEEDHRSLYSRYFGGGDDKDDNEKNDEDDDDEDDDDEADEDYDDQADDDDEGDEADDGQADDDEDTHADENDQADEDDDQANEDDQDDDDDDDEDDNDEPEENYNNVSKEDENDQNSNENDNDSIEKFNSNEDEEDHEEHDEDDNEIEVERIEKEASEEVEPISLELPTLREDDDDDPTQEDDKDVEDTEEQDDDGDDDDFLEADQEPPPVVERVTAPAGKPLPEVDEDDDSTEKPPDTLEEEEEYEKQQEQKRREEEQASHMWLKLVVGGALLVATHAVMRRAAAPRDTRDEEHQSREATPLDRRMTLIPEETATPVVTKKTESAKPVVQELPRRIPAIIKSAPTPQTTIEYDSEEEEADDVEVEEEKTVEQKNKELYSDEEEIDEEEPIVEQKKEVPKFIAPVQSKPAPKPEPKTLEQEEEKEEDDDVPDDVEIIDDELEEEEDDEEEISDVDDVELLSRLEAKYGRLPEPERPGPKHKDGGNSVDDWPGEPSEAYWRQQLDEIEHELREGAEPLSLESRLGAGPLAASGRGRWLSARALDVAAEKKRDNRLLTRAVAAYIRVLEMHESLNDEKLLRVTNRTVDRIQFSGNYLKAEPVYKLLIRRFPDEVGYRNNLTIAYLMINRPELAEPVLQETLQRWPDDRVALAHYAFVIKERHNKFEEAVDLLQRALAGDQGPACEPRFYYHLGDALLRLSRPDEARAVHQRAADKGHFLSASQRSLYNVPRLRSRPWWRVEDTPYVDLARALERSWRGIAAEGAAAHALYEAEKEGLRERGDWSQLELFARGREAPGRCQRAPLACAAVRAEPAAAGCRRGQVKFSSMEPGTHVRAHVGPTNCRLRMHLALANTEGTYIRVDNEIRQWEVGKVLLFDDSFEHEVWHNGTARRLVLIVDVWHPDLTPAERTSLSPI